MQINQFYLVFMLFFKPDEVHLSTDFLSVMVLPSPVMAVLISIVTALQVICKMHTSNSFSPGCVALPSNWAKVLKNFVYVARYFQARSVFFVQKSSRFPSDTAEFYPGPTGFAPGFTRLCQVFASIWQSSSGLCLVCIGDYGLAQVSRLCQNFIKL